MYEVTVPIVRERKWKKEERHNRRPVEFRADV